MALTPPRVCDLRLSGGPRRRIGLDARKASAVIRGTTSGGFRGLGGNGYTLGMDSVRFGRALGVGARVAAKTVVSAMDAATAPNPSAKAAPPEKAEGAGVGLGQQASRTATQAMRTGEGLKEGKKRFGTAMGGRVGRLSMALWLEVTGVFFGIFAVFAAGGAWRMRWALHETSENHDAHVRFVASLVMAVVFGYFCMSSFVKANRKTKGR
jgi:hypothetical protein